LLARESKTKDKSLPYRVFISEYVCGGGWSEGEIPNSLASEGRAMLCAVVEDVARLKLANGRTVSVWTTWDQRLGAVPFASRKNVDVSVVESVEAESSVFDSLSRSADISLVIAPEFDGILHDRVSRVTSLGAECANASLNGIKLFADKWKTYRLCLERDISSVPTRCISNASESTIYASLEFDRIVPHSSSPEELVIKLRDGAGSQSMVVCDQRSFRQTVETLDHSQRWIVQPLMSGTPFSAVGLFDREGRFLRMYEPFSRQKITDDGTFEYQGGVMINFAVEAQSVRETISRFGNCGLRGYVGFDFIMPDDQHIPPLLLEVNPRLTTSYVGYREMFQAANLAEHLLGISNTAPQRKCRSVDFLADGTVLSAERISGHQNE